ncbi:glycosyltransferase [Bacillus sp. V3B]|uniref:glycosyltransferase family 2 protein n=1 Tax=Bacillus sp. V3B TaxID=2804915 RepID=UPI00210E2D7E|nr:glycosyltransferase family 2 protein [Bacillus sp. V3B]MCQ6274867.1 glycosyltransferase [Bacillus sp. V3B]
MENKRDLPLVSIITPSFNQAKFIEETIKSVLSQDYPNIEHIVVDGGSKDGTLEILERYKPSLEGRFRFISEPDQGQSNAINKGLKMAKGDIIGWLNSDDTYLLGAVKKGVNALQTHPEWAMVYGRGYYINEKGSILYPYYVKPNNDKKSLFEDCSICQPATFIKKNVLDGVGGVDENLDFCMDYDLWMRIAKQYTMGFIDDYLANARKHPSAKSVKNWLDIGLPEIFKTCIKHYGTVSNKWLTYYLKTNHSKGKLWIIKRFKSHSIFKNSPFIVKMNRYDDLWVPPNFRILIKVESQHPLYMLLIKGRNHHNFKNLSISVTVNGEKSQNYSITTRDFSLEIPVYSNIADSVVNITSNKHIIPSDLGLSSDKRSLSFIVDEVIPLPQLEYNFMKILKKDLVLVEKWLQNNRKVDPFE